MICSFLLNRFSEAKALCALDSEGVNDGLLDSVRNDEMLGFNDGGVDNDGAEDVLGREDIVG